MGRGANRQLPECCGQNRFGLLDTEKNSVVEKTKELPNWQEGQGLQEIVTGALVATILVSLLLRECSIKD
jgi:hypothetical protein